MLAEILPQMAPTSQLWTVGLEEAKGRTADLLVAHVLSNGLSQLMSTLVEQDHPALIACPPHLTHIVLDEKQMPTQRYGKPFPPVVLDFGDVTVSPFSFRLSVPIKGEFQRLMRSFGALPRNELYVTLAYANRTIPEHFVERLLARIRSTRAMIKIHGQIDCIQHLRRTPKHRLPFDYSVVSEWQAADPIAPAYSPVASTMIRSRTA